MPSATSLSAAPAAIQQDPEVRRFLLRCLQRAVGRRGTTLMTIPAPVTAAER